MFMHNNTPIGSSTNGTSRAKFMASGTQIRVRIPGPTPPWSSWEDDRGRTSGPVKRRLQEMFFRGDRKIRAEVAWVSSESERDELSRKGRLKVKLREASGTTLLVTAALDNIQKA